MALLQRMYELKGVVQHYSWGGFEFIPALIGEKNQNRQPFAEYWLGAHPSAPSLVLPSNKPLNELIQQDPAHFLRTSKNEHGLPFLLKVLDVRQMLSIQVHPSREGAAIGFAEEQQRNIPINASTRNYKDRNHKPELMVALGNFWLLHGFKDEVNMGMMFDAAPELKPLQSIFEEKGYRGLYEKVMLMPQEEVNNILSPLVHRILPLYEQGVLEKDEEDFWAARAALSFCKNGHYDRGIFSIYFFNLVSLKKGEAVYQPPGMPHAYLEGQNVEVMANSDNVLRAGLTDKHIDVPELLKHLKFEATHPKILSAVAGEQTIYETSAEEFELSKLRIESGASHSIETHSAEIMLVTKGVVKFSCEDEEMTLGKGKALFLALASSVSLYAEENATIFRVRVPV